MSKGPAAYGDIPTGFSSLPTGRQSNDIKKVVLKIYLKADDTYKTIAVSTINTTEDTLKMVAKKLGLSAALGGSLVLLERNVYGEERIVGPHEHPGSLQQAWNADSILNKFYVTFSDAGKEEIRKSVMRRLSITAPIPETHSAAERELDSLINDASAVDDDLSQLDSLIQAADSVADDRVSASAAKQKAIPVPARGRGRGRGQMRGRGGRGRGGRGGVSGQRAGMVATNPMQDTVRNVKSRGGQQRVKMISIDQDQEFQGLLKALGEDKPTNVSPNNVSKPIVSTTTTTPARPQPTPPSSTTSSFQAPRVAATPAPAPDTTTAALDADFAALDELENAFADSMAAAESSFQSSTNNTAQATPVTSTNFNTNTTTTTTSHTSNNNNNVTDTTQSDLDALDSLLQDSLATGDDINAEVSFNNADDLIALEEPVFEPTPAPKQDLNDAKSGGETFDFDEVFGRLDLKALNELGLDENDAEEPKNTGSSTMDLDFDNLLVQLSKDLY